MSFLNSSSSTLTITPIPSHITKSHLLSVLHNPDKMIRMNPLVRAHKRLPDSSSTAFFANESKDLKPSNETIVPVYEVTEDMGGGDEAQAGTWRGGWAKRFIPDSLTYETSLECRDDGMLSITHAPMGVHSSTTWVMKEGEDGGLLLEERGRVTSNRMLMSFIKTTLQESHEKLVKDFMAAVEKEAAGEGEGKDDAEVEKVS